MNKNKFTNKGLTRQQNAQVEQMYTQYRPLVRATIRNKMHCSIDEAEDLTEEVFERVCRSFKNGSGPNSLNATQRWLMKIAENVCLSNIKKQNGLSFISLETPVFQDEVLADQIVASEHTPEEEAEQRESTRALHTGIEELPARQQMAVRLHYGNELTLTEISAISGQPPSTVKRNIDKGIQQLHQRLGNE